MFYLCAETKKGHIISSSIPDIYIKSIFCFIYLLIFFGFVNNEMGF